MENEESNDDRLARIEHKLDLLIYHSDIRVTFPSVDEIVKNCFKEFQAEALSEMEKGNPAEGYVHHGKVFRKGSIYKRRFYYMWGDKVRNIPLKNVDRLIKL